MSKLKYNRVLLKLSGESIGGKSGFGIDVDQAESIANRIKEVYEMGVQVALVIGAGNCGAGNRGWSAAWTVQPPITWACSARS